MTKSQNHIPKIMWYTKWNTILNLCQPLILGGYLISQNCYEALWIPKKEKGS